MKLLTATCRALARVGEFHIVKAFAISLAASSLPNAATAQNDRAIQVFNDPGGDLIARVEYIDRLKRSRKPVQIRKGYCISACTLYLGLDQTCVGRNATFGFHGPSSSVYGVGLSPERFEHWSRVMADHYPEPIRGWFLQTGHQITMGFYEFTGADLIQMGVPECA